MNLTDLKTTLEKVQLEKAGFEFELTEGADERIFQKTENRLGLTIPDKTKEFFKTSNGLRTKNPDLTILGVQDWSRTEEDLIHFSTFDRRVRIYFDSRKINQADQWTITNPSADYDLTVSLSSFWSNKIWHWIRNRREIWKDEFWTKENK